MKDLFNNVKKFILVNIVIGTLGMIVSLYSIGHHKELKNAGVTDAACNINQTISCDAVAGSQYSELFGVPLGVFGLAFFIALITLAAITIKHEKHRESNTNALATLSGVGGVVSIVLASISVFSIGAVCITCILVYVLCLGLLVNTGFAIKNGEITYSFKSSYNGLINAGLITAVILIGYSQLFTGSDPTQHPNYVKKDGEPAAEAPPTLSTRQYDIPVNMSDFSGFGQDYRKGSDEAKITIVEFADMECPACARVSMTMNDIAKKYGSKVNVVFKNYPLDKKCNGSIARDFHQYACDLAVLARCAGQKGKFWEYHDLVFANQGDIGKGVPEKWAKIVGLTQKDIDACLTNQGLVDKIKDDIKLGNRVDVSGTPSIYINGRKLLASPNFYAITFEIEKLLAK